MAPGTPSQGLPSPKPRSASTPSATFPFIFAPHLPQLGTAKVRLRSNVFGLFAFAGLWWQHSLYASSRNAIVWTVGSIIGEESLRWVFNSIESIIFFVLAWNVLEATYIIYRAPSSPTPAPAPSGALKAIDTRLERNRRPSLRDSLSSPPSKNSPMNFSTPSFLNSSSTFSTPTRATGSTSSLRYDKPTSRFAPSASQSSFFGSTSSFGQSHGGSPLASYSGRHLPTNGRSLDGRMLEQLLDAVE